MLRYAIIDGTDVINVIEYESDPGNPPPGFEAPIIAVQSDSAGPGWAYVGGEFIKPIISDLPSIPLTEQAQTMLAKSDITALRCLSAGVAVPPEWQTYRSMLRAVILGKQTTMPVQPKFPEGT